MISKNKVRVLKVAGALSFLAGAVALFKYGYKAASFCSFAASLGLFLSVLPVQYVYIPATVSIAFSLSAQILEAFTVYDTQVTRGMKFVQSRLKGN
jgi:hypothetical protein